MICVLRAVQARFVEGDLECVANLIGLQSITSVHEHQGSRRLFLFEQLTHLDRCFPSSTPLIMMLAINIYRKGI